MIWASPKLKSSGKGGSPGTRLISMLNKTSGMIHVEEFNIENASEYKPSENVLLVHSKFGLLLMKEETVTTEITQSSF